MLHAIATADWHLDALRTYFPFEHADLQLREIDKIYKLASSKGLKDIFVPGDLSDRSSMESETQIKLLKHFTKYDGSINTWYSHGNHDIHDIKSTSLDFFSVLCEIGMLKTLKIFKQSEQMVIDDVVVNMVSFPSNDVPEHKDPCLNFAHVEYTGAIGDNGRPLKAGKKHTIKVPKKDYTVSGHVHTYQELKKQRALYTGNPYQKNFGETCAKGVIEFKASPSKGKMKFKHQFIRSKPAFSFNTLEINDQKDFGLIPQQRQALTRIYLGEEIILPDDLRMRHPNVVQIHRRGGTPLKVLTNDEEFSQHQAEIPAIDPLKGLVEFLRSIEYSKKECASAISMVKEALAEIS